MRSSWSQRTRYHLLMLILILHTRGCSKTTIKDILSKLSLAILNTTETSTKTTLTMSSPMLSHTLVTTTQRTLRLCCLRMWMPSIDASIPQLLKRSWITSGVKRLKDPALPNYASTRCQLTRLFPWNLLWRCSAMVDPLTTEVPYTMKWMWLLTKSKTKSSTWVFPRSSWNPIIPVQPLKTLVFLLTSPMINSNPISSPTNGQTRSS